MPTGISLERQKGISLPKAALALTPLTIGVLSACSNNPAVKPPEGITPAAVDTATAIVPMTPAHAPSIIPASPTITVEVSPSPSLAATETVTTTVPVVTPTAGTALPHPGTPFAIPSATETNPTATKEATATPTLSPEEIRKEAHDISVQLTTGEYAAVPADLDPARREAIRAAIEQVLIMTPYGVTPEQLNQMILKKTGKDFRQYINNLYGKFGINFDTEMAKLRLNGPADVFYQITIDPYHYSAGTFTSWSLDKDTIYLAPGYESHPAYLADALFKETVANHISDNATDIRLQKIAEAQAQGKPIPPPSKLISGNNQLTYGGSMSFALMAYMEQHYIDTGHSLPPGSVDITTALSYALSGPLHSELPK